jgi:hypothetical protein
MCFFVYAYIHYHILMHAFFIKYQYTKFDVKPMKSLGYHINFQEKNDFNQLFEGKKKTSNLKANR